MSRLKISFWTTYNQNTQVLELVSGKRQGEDKIKKEFDDALERVQTQGGV